MMHYRLLHSSVLLIIVFSFICCNNQGRAEQSDPDIVVTDMLGRKVTVPANIDKVVALRAGALRLLVYMDAADMIAGVEENEKRSSRPYLLAFPELMKLPSVGPQMGGDPELIVAAQPDVIFISYSTVGEADALQQKTGIPVVAIDCPDLQVNSNGLFDSFSLIGKILHKKNRADSLIKGISSMIEELNTRTSSIKPEDKPGVYVGGVAYSGAHGIASTHGAFAPFLFVNANNVVSGKQNIVSSHVKGTNIDIEQLLLWNPDIIFIDESGYSLALQDINNQPALKKSLDAIRNNQLYCLLPYNNYATNYEFVLLNAWFAGKIIYPQQFEDIDIETKASEVLTLFFNKPVSLSQMKSALGLRKITPVH